MALMRHMFGVRMPMGKTVFKFVAATLLASAAGAAMAQDAYDFGLDEVRGGLLFHSVDHAPPGMFIDTSRFQDLNVELLWQPFDLGDWNWIGDIRPHLGGTFNFGGLESQVYAGLTWTYYIAGGPVFIEGSFGGTIHNGALAGATLPARNLGCSVLFRESAAIGYQFTEQTNVSLMVDHSSHAGLCGNNNYGLTNLGVRFGWKF